MTRAWDILDHWDATRLWDILDHWDATRLWDILDHWDATRLWDILDHWDAAREKGGGFCANHLDCSIQITLGLFYPDHALKGPLAMLVFSSLKRRTYAAAGVAATCAFVLLSVSTPATAQQVIIPSDLPVVQLANPGPGDVRREAGGTFLGSAVPGQNTIANVTPGTRMARTGFEITVTLPSSATGGGDFFAFAWRAAGVVLTSQFVCFGFLILSGHWRLSF